MIWNINWKSQLEADWNPMTWAKCVPLLTPSLFQLASPLLPFCFDVTEGKTIEYGGKTCLAKSAQSDLETSPEGLGSGRRWATHLLCDLEQVVFLSGPLFSALRKYLDELFLRGILTQTA